MNKFYRVLLFDQELDSISLGLILVERELTLEYRNHLRSDRRFRERTDETKRLEARLKKLSDLQGKLLFLKENSIDGILGLVEKEKSPEPKLGAVSELQNSYSSIISQKN